MAQQPLVGQDLIKSSLSHSDTPNLVGFLWTSDQPDAETTTWQHSRKTSIPPAGFEPAVPASVRPQTHALDLATTGIGCLGLLVILNLFVGCSVFRWSCVCGKQPCCIVRGMVEPVLVFPLGSFLLFPDIVIICFLFPLTGFDSVVE